MLGNFVCVRYRLSLDATSPLRLSAFAGSTLRGGFGHVFKRSVCVWSAGDCARCLLKNTCCYPYIFETSPPPGSEKLRGIDQIPRPFVIEPPEGDRREFAPGDRFDFGLVLVGRAIHYLPYFVFTFTELGQAGLGPDRGQYRLQQVHEEGSAGERQIYSATDGVLHESAARVTTADLTEGAGHGERFTIHFFTPTRIRTGGRVRTEITFQDLARALLRRLSSLTYFHCGSELSVDFRSLIDHGSAVRTVDSQLHWHDQSRFSGRQHQRIDMGGVVGSVTYEAPTANVLAPYWPLLRAGQWVHVGKGCVMGLGKYRISRV